jgi:hypothetical protein
MGIKLHPDDIQDVKFKERAEKELYWQDLIEAEECLDNIILASKQFESEFDNNYYYSEKALVSDRMARLKGKLDDFMEELETFRLVVGDYYE